MTGREIGRIGAYGGVSLALLKLIESGFFLDQLLSTNAKAAFLTYVAYIFLGVMGAVFFTDRSLSPEQIKKGAFTMGLSCALSAPCNNDTTTWKGRND